MSDPACCRGHVNTNNRLNPDHHIWNNNGTWWCHFTVHNPDQTKERVRVSLHTKNRDEARQRRDFIMRGTAAIVGNLPRLRGRTMRSGNITQPSAAPGFASRESAPAAFFRQECARTEANLERR